MIKYDDRDYTVNFEKFQTADIVKRGNFWFVDVIYYDETKDTNFRFTERKQAEKFLNYCFETFAENNDVTKYNGYHLFSFFVIGLLSGILLNML